jgi:hypothetical protein
MRSTTSSTTPASPPRRPPGGCRRHAPVYITRLIRETRNEYYKTHRDGQNARPEHLLRLGRGRPLRRKRRQAEEGGDKGAKGLGSSVGCLHQGLAPAGIAHVRLAPEEHQHPGVGVLQRDGYAERRYAVVRPLALLLLLILLVVQPIGAEPPPHLLLIGPPHHLLPLHDAPQHGGGHALDPLVLLACWRR